MTSWFIGVKASVISGAPLYSKSISYLFPVGKRQVLFAKRSYIEKFGFEPVPRQQTKRPTGVDRFLFYGGPSGVQPAPQAAAAALSRLARCAGKRSRVYSAPRPDGFEPMPWQQKSGRHPPVAFSFLWWAVRGSARCAGGRCGAFAPCALRWQTLTRLLSSAPRRVRTHALATKKRPASASRFFFSMVGRQGFEPWTLGLKVPCSAS